MFRDPLRHPYRSTSIWNTPIGTGARREPAGLAPALQHGEDLVTVDPILIGLDPTDPVRPFSTYPYTRNAAGDTKPFTPKYVIPPGAQVHIPDDLTHNGSYNGIFALLAAPYDPAHPTAWVGQPLWRLDDDTDPAYPEVGPHPATAGNLTGAPIDLCSDGLGGAGHGGSRMAALGGVIRAHEWWDTAPIRHALAINLFGERFLSAANGGYRWPASHADSGYNSGVNTGSSNNYGRTGDGYDHMGMGTLLALPLWHSGATHPQAQRIEWTLRNHGAYVVDNTKRDVHAFSVESTIQAAWEDAGPVFHSEVMGMVSELEAVVNNDSMHIGGGGRPLTTPVPELP